MTPEQLMEATRLMENREAIMVWKSISPKREFNVSINPMCGGTGIKPCSMYLTPRSTQELLDFMLPRIDARLKELGVTLDRP